jgi:AraC-like DNA-binding protein
VPPKNPVRFSSRVAPDPLSGPAPTKCLHVSDAIRNLLDMHILVLTQSGEDRPRPFDGCEDLWKRGAMVVTVPGWMEANRATTGCHGRSLLLASQEALLTLVSFGRAETTLPCPPFTITAPSAHPSSPRSGWYVVSIRLERFVEPSIVLALHQWGVHEHLHIEELRKRGMIDRLARRSVTGANGARVRWAVLLRVGASEHEQVARIVDATLAGISERETSVEVLAGRVYMSQSTLGRTMRRAGLTTPSRFIHRVRVILAVLLRADSAYRTQAWRQFGFSSPVHLSNSVRTQFGYSLRELDVVGAAEMFPLLISKLFEGCPQIGNPIATETGEL